MKTRTPAIVISAVLLLFPAALLSQEQERGLTRNLGGFCVGGLFPTGAFNDHVPQNGWAFGLYWGRRAGNSPVFIGCEIWASIYGYTHRYEVLDEIPEVMFDVYTYNNIGQALLFVRFQPRRTGALVSYIQAMAGPCYLWTETTVSGHGDPDYNLASDVNFDDYTMTAGIEAGLSLRLGRPAQGSGLLGRGVFVDFKARYMAGGQAAYLREGSIIVGDGDYAYIPERSATNFLTFQAGLTWLF